MLVVSFWGFFGWLVGFFVWVFFEGGFLGGDGGWVGGFGGVFLWPCFVLFLFVIVVLVLFSPLPSPPMCFPPTKRVKTSSSTQSFTC